MPIYYNQFRLMQVEESVSSNNVFSFKQGKGNNNRLVNKNIPGVMVDQFSHIVHCRDSQTEPTVVRSQHPLQNDISLSYFEVEVLGVTSEDSICIGLMAKDNNIKQYPGKNNNSFGYFKGEFFLCKKKVGAIASYQKLQAGDYLGMGINCLKKTIYVVKNGKIVLNNLAIPTTWAEYYPAVGVSREDQKIKFVFNQRDFKFNYEFMKKQVERQTESEVKKGGISNAQIYPLIFQYLSFHGYTKTFEALQEKEKDFYKIPKLCKHPGITRPAINLNSSNENLLNEDVQMNEPLRAKSRNRIMSERLDEQNFNLEAIRRKNTEMAVDPQRKQSYFENLSNASNYCKSEKNIIEEDQKQQDLQLLDQNQTFLLNQKFEIVNLIKQKKIEKAMQIIEKNIPALLEDTQVVAFMKAHIFLRIVKEESSLAAIAFSQKEKDIFSYHQQTLFPFYVLAKDKVEWKPLKYIFNALAYNAKGGKKENGDILSYKQYEHFSSYIKSLIHKKMGYLGCSRLAFFINNTKKILEKIKDYRGVTCGIELIL